MHCDFFSFHCFDSHMYECKAEGSGLVFAQGHFAKRVAVCPLPGKMHGQVGWGFEQASLVQGVLLMAGRLH